MSKPIIQIRGTRILVTPSADAELPEAERRVFKFLSPTWSAYDRLTTACARKDEAGEVIFDTRKLLGRLLRGWSNVRTDDAETAAKYGVEVPAGGGEVEIPSPDTPALRDAVDFFDVLTLAEWRELVDAVIGTISPVASGN